MNTEGTNCNAATIYFRISIKCDKRNYTNARD